MNIMLIFKILILCIVALIVAGYTYILNFSDLFLLLFELRYKFEIAFSLDCLGGKPFFLICLVSKSLYRGRIIEQTRTIGTI